MPNQDMLDRMPEADNDDVQAELNRLLGLEALLPNHSVCEQRISDLQAENQRLREALKERAAE